MVDLTRPLSSLGGRVKRVLLDGAAARFDFVQGQTTETMFIVSTSCFAGKRGAFDKRVPRPRIGNRRVSRLYSCMYLTTEDQLPAVTTYKSITSIE